MFYNDDMSFTLNKKIVIPISIIIVLVLAVLIAFRVSPAPGAAIIRIVFDKDAHQKREAMEKLPGTPTNVELVSDISYAEGDKDAVLDVYVPKNSEYTNKSLPVVVWTHGGAWISGDKTDTVPYFKRLADKGFVVVAVNYSLAPQKKYPYQIEQLNKAHAFIKNNIQRYNGNPSKIVLAGDSAGSQLSSQLAAIATNPSYASEMNIQPSLEPSDIAGMVLYCGIYKMETLAEHHKDLSKIVSWGNRITIWSYTGTRDSETPLIKQMSAYYHANSDFPDSFISGGNGDLLTDVQSKPFATKLQEMGVDVETKFYEANHTPSLPHENQFVLDKDGLENFETMVNFLKQKTS